MIRQMLCRYLVERTKERFERTVKLVDVLNMVEPVLDASAAQLHEVDGLLLGQSNIPRGLVRAQHRAGRHGGMQSV